MLGKTPTSSLWVDRIADDYKSLLDSRKYEFYLSVLEKLKLELWINWMKILCEVKYVKYVWPPDEQDITVRTLAERGGSPEAHNEKSGPHPARRDFIGENLGGGFEKLNIIS